MNDRRAPCANDNTPVADERPVVTVPRDRPELAYARRDNLILPLRFAQQMRGWEAGGHWGQLTIVATLG
jgi:hypothetical protein